MTHYATARRIDVKDMIDQLRSELRSLLDETAGLTRDVRIDPEKKFISGKNTIRFKMLSDDTRIEIKERGTGKPVASLDLPVNFRIEFKDLFVKLDEAKVRLDNVQL